MIKRKRVNAPQALTITSDAFNKEKEEVEAWLRSDFHKDLKPDFKLYKHEKVPELLELMFQGKCAYCESPYTRTQPLDIEHFRPKSEVLVELTNKTETKVGVYAKLAMEWDNLLPSCIDCNRARYQYVYRKNPIDGSYQWKKLKQGKANSFPLFDETMRASAPLFDISGEQCLLLNPCTDEPSKYLEYDDSGVMKAIALPSSENVIKREIHWQKAIRSIEIYGLNRKGLVDMRREYILRLKMRFEMILKLIDLSNEIGKDIRSFKDKVPTRTLNKLVKKTTGTIEAMIEQEVELLMQLTEPTKPYSALAKQFVQAFVNEFIKA
ncbi:MAG: hypothetical protein IPO10_10535 [Flavobacteriales bacterium]|nr:hypothetical protein [Flavobacteriales bacterium]